MLTEQERIQMTKTNNIMRDGNNMADKIIHSLDIKPEFKKEAFIMDFAYSQKHQILGAVGSDGRIFFYVSKDKIFYLKRLFIIDTSELSLQDKIWYAESHDVWLTSGKDNVLREWSINSE